MNLYAVGVMIVDSVRGIQDIIFTAALFPYQSVELSVPLLHNRHLPSNRFLCVMTDI